VEDGRGPAAMLDGWRKGSRPAGHVQAGVGSNQDVREQQLLLHAAAQCLTLLNQHTCQASHSKQVTTKGPEPWGRCTIKTCRLPWSNGMP
jgi:hypothetical protein